MTDAEREVKLSLSKFARRLITEWKRLGLPATRDRVIVAVSGGADSTALLLALHELQKGKYFDSQVIVAYLDHSLRGDESEDEARWVSTLAVKLGFEVELGRADVGERAARTGDNLEQAARRARYEFLGNVAERCGARLLLTGHTMDDQAETVMLRLLRGSGAEGLGGMEPVRALVTSSDILLARPLLRWARRTETERYCRERGVEFRSDRMNEDERFARVRVRGQLLPLMATFNPLVVESLSRAAELLREDAAVLNGAANELLKSATEEAANPADDGSASNEVSLSIAVLSKAPPALRRRALRLWIQRRRGDLRRLELVHLLGIEELLVGERGGRRAELPGGGFVENRRGRLWFYVK